MATGGFCGIKEDDLGYDYTEFKYLMFTGFDSGSVSEQTYFELYQKLYVLKKAQR